MLNHSNKKNRLFFSLVWIFIIQLNAWGQNFGDKDFYLLDSIDLNEVSKADKLLLDTNLIAFHNTTDDTLELAYLENIVDECWNNDIWPRYNQLIIDIVSKKLAINTQEAIRNKFLYFLAGAINNNGYLYDQKGDMILALDNYHKGLDLYEFVGDKTGISTSLNNLGVLYSMIGDTTKALTYHRRSLELKKELKDPYGVAMSLNNIGTIYENHNRPFEALNYYDQSLEIREEIEDQRGIAMSYDNIGDIYLSQDFTVAALSYYEKGLKTWEELEDPVGISTSCDNVANALIKLDRHDEAKEYALRSNQIAEELGYVVDIKNSSITLSVIYKHDKDYKKALEKLETYVDMRNKMENSEFANAALKKSLFYEFQKTSLQDSLNNAKVLEIQDLELSSQRTQNIALYVGIGLMLVIFILGIRSFVRKKKDHQLIMSQKLEVESKNKEITDSITYAKRIQLAILPPEEMISKHLKNGFVLYKPKDVVSGDFYWMEVIDDEIIFAVADCTGHGVPGAMVSVVCHNALNRSVFEFGLTKPSDILNKTRDLVIETFMKSDKNVKDGMDIALCSLNRKTNLLNYSGANNSLYLVDNNELKTIKADKQPIGKFAMSTPFTNHTIQLNNDNSIFLSSDGYPDQFGGPEGKKFKYKQFREMLLNNSSKAMKTQKEILDSTFENWKGNLEQIDDVCVIGVRI